MSARQRAYFDNAGRSGHGYAPDETADRPDPKYMDMRFAFLDSMVADNAIFRSPDLRTGDNTPFELVVMGMLKNEGDRALLTDFTNQWGPAGQWIEDNIPVRARLGIIYGNGSDGDDLLTSLMDNATTGADIVDGALAKESSLTLQEYSDKVVAAGLNTAQGLKDILDAGPIANQQVGFGVLSEEFSLAEHHVYGSARLGVQYYQSGAGTVASGTTNAIPDHYGLTNRWNYSNSAAPATFYNLNTPAVWYSAAYGDLVKKGQKSAFGNWDDGQGASGTENAIASLDNPISNYYHAGRVLGLRQYELSDHLSNVLATVLDRKVGSANSRNYTYTVTYPDPNNTGAMIPVSASAVVYNYWKADVVSSQDYYPFGMQMPGRTYSSGVGLLAKNGFNGKRNDDETYGGKGNFQDYGMRGYDPRLARFWGVDPLTQKYPFYTPYQFAGNKPIQFVDIDGKEEGWPDIFTKARGAINTILQICNAASTLAKVTEKGVDLVQNTKYTVYAKVEGKITLGARASIDIKNFAGLDVNMGSVTALSFVAEWNFTEQKWGELEFDYLYKDGTVKKTFGMAAAIPLGMLEGIPVGVGGSFQVNGVTKNGVPQKEGSGYEVNGGATAGGVGVNGGYKEESTSDGTKRSGKIVASHGGAFGVGAVIDYNIESGVRMENTSKNKSDGSSE